MINGFFKSTLLTAIAAATVGLGHSAAQHKACEGFVPENDMKIPVGFQHPWARGTRSGLTQDQFNGVIARAEKLYAPVIAKAGGTLKVNRLWDNETVNANATQQGRTWTVNMYGGLARHPAINIEGFALVICHEIGHHIGGAPKGQDWWGSPSWATNEGGADYFATLKCLRNFFAEDDNEAIVSAAQIDPLAKERCEKEFATRADQLFCERSSMSGMSVAYLFMDLRKENKPPQYNTPDPNVVKEMFDDHPGTQCRMDTYLNGATCHVDKSVALSNTDYREGSCTQPNDTIGFRPLCWFKP